MNVTLRWRGTEHRAELPEGATGKDLARAAVNISKLHPDRVRVVWEEGQKRTPVTDDNVISEIGVTTFSIRDLGPQFSYRGVFLIEYVGPFLIWLLFAAILRPTCNTYFKLASVMWLFHYGKRLFETVFVHIFSHGTMPLRNLFKNSSYYWGFAAVIAWSVASRASDFDSISAGQAVAVIAFILCEIVNGYCHLALRWMRPKGSKEHVLPKGFLFDAIACPNYTAEILAWVSFAVFARGIPEALFPVVGAVQMWVWADGKRKRLIAEWPEARNRGRLTPFRAL
jgi:very-long-chain enoyl-CoA reductase